MKSGTRKQWLLPVFIVLGEEQNKKKQRDSHINILEMAEPNSRKFAC